VEHTDPGGKPHSYLPALAVAVVAAIVIGSYIGWDISEDKTLARRNSQAVQDIKQELLKARVESQTARLKMKQAEQDLQNTQTELKQVQQKLKDALAQIPPRRHVWRKEPPAIVTQREFEEMEYDETLKRAMFKTPRAEAERMVEKPIILLDGDVEIPENIRRLKEAKPQKCKKCQGTGWIKCPHCGEDVPCYRCAGKGTKQSSAGAALKMPTFKMPVLKIPPPPRVEEPAEAVPERVIERVIVPPTAGKFERDAREMAASQALGRARNFDKSNMYEDKEKVAAKYKEVVEKYPGTEAAEEAAEQYKKVMQRRK
jgi:hypothetical protein